MKKQLSTLVLAAVLASLAGCKDEAGPAQVVAGDPPATSITVAPGAPVVLAFGDSLYAGYQLDPGQSYPARLEAALNAGGSSVRFVNAGVSGDTTAAGLQRLAFTLDNQPIRPALVMVGLGGNDMLRGLPPEDTRANLDAICAELKKRGIPFMLTGLYAAPNLGQEYAAKFNAIYPELARKYDVPLVPFLLEPVVGNKALLLPDSIHPNAAGIDKIVAATKDEVEKAVEAAAASG